MRVAVIMGSDSDLPVMSKCIDTLKDFGVSIKVMVCSAHRTPERAAEFAKSAKNDGFGVIIAAAGKAAHLGGVLAAFTTLPVVAVPMKTSMMGGLDSLLSMVQMPEGIPVATVAVDGAVNAALLAVQILGISDGSMSEKMSQYKKDMEAKVEKKDRELQEKLKNE